MEEFRLELETWESKKNQLEPIIQCLRNLESKPKLADPTDPQCTTAAKFVLAGPPETWQWSRSPRLNDEDWPVYREIAMLNLHVVILRWRAKYSPVSRESTTVAAPLTETRTMEPALFFPRPNPRILPNDVVMNSSKQAEAVEKISRDRFENLMGGLEAKKLMAEWKSQGSLLKLESNPDYGVKNPGIWTDLSWLTRFRT